MAFSQLLASIVLLGHLVENRPERCTTEGDLQQSLLQLENKGTHILQYWTGELWFELCGIDPEWNETAAVACRQLGFSDQGAEVTLTAELSTATLTAKLDQRCNGTETSLAECGVTVGDFQCTVGGITCQAATCDNSSVRLVDGYTNHDGRVEVCVDGQWGTVCNNNQEEIAETICSQLGFAVTGAEVISPIPTLSLPVHSCTVVNNYTLTCTSLIPDVSGSCNQLGILCKIKEEITKLCGMPTQENGTSIATTANPQPSTAGSQESGKTVAFQDDGTTTTTTRDAEAVNQSRMATNESNTTDSASSPMNLLEANTSTVDTSTRHGSEFTPMATLQGCNMTTITVLGAVIGVLVTLQTVTLIMWMVSCCINRRQKSSKLKPSSPHTPTETSTYYSLDQVYNETTPTQPDSSSQGPPNYDMATTINEGIGIYDSIDNQLKTSTTQVRPANNPSPISNEVSKRGDDFYDAEEHTYAVVNKKKKKSEDGEGDGGELERAEPQNNN